MLIGHGNAGILSLPDKSSCVGGSVVILANKKTGRCCVLNWRSKKLVRKVVRNFGFQKILGSKNFGSRKILGPEKILGLENFGVWIIFWVWKNFVFGKILSLEIF